MDEVICKECCFLGIYNSEENRIEELNQLCREEGGHIPLRFYKIPFCAKMKLKDNWQGYDNEGNRFRNVIGTYRKCDGFAPYAPGFTPQERITMDLVAQEKLRIERRENYEKRLRWIELGVFVIATFGAAYLGAVAGKSGANTQSAMLQAPGTQNAITSGTLQSRP